ncbi:MAG: hypothetical protein AAGI17_08845, partial [Planctomycetota bacterium]
MLFSLITALLAQPAPEPFTFTSEGQAGVWTHRAVVERPDPAFDTGYAVMLWSGGFATDLNWSLPGSYTIEGETTRLTITGKTHRDG